MPQVLAGQRVTGGVISSEYNLSDATTFGGVSGTSLAQISNQWSVPANEAIAGSVYILRAWGNGTQGSTAQTLQFSASFGGLTTGLGPTFPASFAATNTAFRWWMEAEAMCISTGAGGTWQVSLTGVCGVGTAALVTTAQNAAAISVATTSAIPVMIQAAWGSVTGAPTAAGLRSRWSKLL